MTTQEVIQYLQAKIDSNMKLYSGNTFYFLSYVASFYKFVAQKLVIQQLKPGFHFNRNYRKSRSAKTSPRL